MKLLTEIRVASPNARDTIYVPVVVEAKDGGDAQRKALEIAQGKYPRQTVSGGPVCPATDDAIAAAEEKLGMKVLSGGKKAKPRPAPVVGVPDEPA